MRQESSDSKRCLLHKKYYHQHQSSQQNPPQQPHLSNSLSQQEKQDQHQQQSPGQKLNNSQSQSNLLPSNCSVYPLEKLASPTVLATPTRIKPSTKTHRNHFASQKLSQPQSTNDNETINNKHLSPISNSITLPLVDLQLDHTSPCRLRSNHSEFTSNHHSQILKQTSEYLKHNYQSQQLHSPLKKSTSISTHSTLATATSQTQSNHHLSSNRRLLSVLNAAAVANLQAKHVASNCLSNTSNIISTKNGNHYKSHSSSNHNNSYSNGIMTQLEKLRILTDTAINGDNNSNNNQSSNIHTLVNAKVSCSRNTDECMSNKGSSSKNKVSTAKLLKNLRQIISATSGVATTITTTQTDRRKFHYSNDNNIRDEKSFNNSFIPLTKSSNSNQTQNYKQVIITNLYQNNNNNNQNINQQINYSSPITTSTTTTGTAASTNTVASNPNEYDYIIKREAFLNSRIHLPSIHSEQQQQQQQQNQQISQSQLSQQQQHSKQFGPTHLSQSHITQKNTQNLHPYSGNRQKKQHGQSQFIPGQSLNVPNPHLFHQQVSQAIHQMHMNHSPPKVESIPFCLSEDQQMQEQPHSPPSQNQSAATSGSPHPSLLTPLKHRLRPRNKRNTNSIEKIELVLPNNLTPTRSTRKRIQKDAISPANSKYHLSKNYYLSTQENINSNKSKSNTHNNSHVIPVLKAAQISLTDGMTSEVIGKDIVKEESEDPLEESKLSEVNDFEELKSYYNRKYSPVNSKRSPFNRNPAENNNTQRYILSGNHTLIPKLQQTIYQSIQLNHVKSVKSPPSQNISTQVAVAPLVSSIISVIPIISSKQKSTNSAKICDGSRGVEAEQQGQNNPELPLNHRRKVSEHTKYESNSNYDGNQLCLASEKNAAQDVAHSQRIRKAFNESCSNNSFEPQPWLNEENQGCSTPPFIETSFFAHVRTQIQLNLYGGAIIVSNKRMGGKIETDLD